MNAARRLAALEDAHRAPDRLAEQCEADADRIVAALGAMDVADGTPPSAPDRAKLLNRIRRANDLPDAPGEVYDGADTL